MRRKIGSKTSFYLTESQKITLEEIAKKLEVSVSALSRGIIRLKQQQIISENEKSTD